MATITTTNGFLTTLGEINIEDKSHEEIINYPAINVLVGREVYKNATKGGHVDGFLFKEVQVTLDVFQDNVNDLRTERNQILHDLEKYFLVNYFLPDTGGVGTALNTKVSNVIIWGTQANIPYGGFTVELLVSYQQNIFNPKSKAQGRMILANDQVTPAISARESIREAPIFNMKKIQTSSDFLLNIGDVNEDLFSAEEMINFPSVNVGEEQEEHANAFQENFNDLRERRQLPMTIDWFLEDVNDIETKREKALADTESVIMNNFNFPNSAGKTTALESMFTFNEPFGIEGTVPRGGIRIGLTIFYRTDVGDPALVT